MVPPAVKATLQDLATELGRSIGWVSREALVRGLETVSAPGPEAGLEPTSAEVDALHREHPKPTLEEVNRLRVANGFEPLERLP